MRKFRLFIVSLSALCAQPWSDSALSWATRGHQKPESILEIGYESVELNAEIQFQLCHVSEETSVCDPVGPLGQSVTIPLVLQGNRVYQGNWKAVKNVQNFKATAKLTVWVIGPDKIFMRAHLNSAVNNDLLTLKKTSLEVGTKSEEHLNRLSLTGDETKLSDTLSVIPVLYVGPKFGDGFLKLHTSSH